MVAVMARTKSLFAIFLCLVCVALVVPVFAQKLDKDACKAFKSERAEFLNSGILDEMSKGPEWVKDNLTSEQIGRIKRYLTVDATVIFQCPNGGGPAIKRKKPVSGQKKAGTRKSLRKKKIIRKKTRAKKKKTSSLAFDPFAGD